MKTAMDLIFGKQIEKSTTQHVRCYYLVQKYIGMENGIPEFSIECKGFICPNTMKYFFDLDLVFAYLDDSTNIPTFYHRQDIIDGHVSLPTFMSTHFKEDA